MTEYEKNNSSAYSSNIARLFSSFLFFFSPVCTMFAYGLIVVICGCYKHKTVVIVCTVCFLCIQYKPVCQNNLFHLEPEYRTPELIVERSFFLFCFVWHSMGYQLLTKYCEAEKKLSMPSQQVSFHYISSAPQQQAFLNDLLHRRPSVPFSIVDSHLKLQAQICHMDAAHSQVKHTLWDLEFIKHRRD